MLHLLTAVAWMVTGSNICTTQNCVVYAETATDLYQIDPVQLTQTHLCTFPSNLGNVNDIAVDANGTVYALTAGELYTVNPSNCASTQLASVSSLGDNFNGLSFLLDGRLVAVDDQGTVAQIDTVTGAVTELGSYGNNLGSSGDLVALSNGQIYATAFDVTGTDSEDLLVTVDPNTFAATVVGPITNHNDIWGLGYWAGVLYGFDYAGQVLKIDPSTGDATVAITNSNLQWFGAGTTPLAPTTCQSTCSAGQTACNNNGDVLNCVQQSNGCYDWVPSSCGSGQTCSNGQCVATCSNTCFPFSGGCADATDVKSCDLQANGCFDWDVSACPANQVCSRGSCVPNCTNQCSPGQTQCSGSDIQNCQQQSNGCYGWVTTQTCGGGEICSSGQCATQCTDACTVGAQQCSGSIPQTCAVRASGCAEWVNGNDCGAAGCSDGQCCGCTLGEVQCTADGQVEVCTASASNACPTWVAQPCASGACESGMCLTACNPSSEVSQCGDGAQCVSMAGGNYCGLPDGNGGYVPAPPSQSGGSAGTGGTSASGGTTGLSGGGTTGLGTDSGGAGGTTGSTQNTGTSSGSGTTVSSQGCGCNSTSPSSSLALMLGLLGLAGVRRRR